MLADTLRKFLFDLNVDDGLSALGYSKDDIPSLVKGTLPQVRFHTVEELEGTTIRSARGLVAPLTAAREPTVQKQPGPCTFVFARQIVAGLKEPFTKSRDANSQTDLS